MTEVVDFPVKPEARDYLARFARDAGEPGWLAARRQQAMTRFAELGFPSRRSESWRYLDLQPLERTPLLPALPPARPDTAALRERVAALALSSAGRLSRPGRWPLRRRAVPLAAATRGLVRRDRPGNARACRPCRDRSGGNIGRGGTAFRRPQRRLFRRRLCPVARTGGRARRADRDHSSGVGIAAKPRFIPAVWRFSATDSRASIIETYAGVGRYWRNDVLAARLAEGAVLHRTVAVEEAPEALHFGHLDATLAAHARILRFRAAARRPPRAARGRRAPSGRGRPRSARRRVPRRRQRRGEYRHHGRSRRARRADQRTGQGRRGGSRARRVSGLHDRARGRAEDRCAASRAAT